MGTAYPNSDEFKAHIRRRLENALQLSREVQHIEFKQSDTWDHLKYKLTRTALAMSNLRDGGLIIIGVSQQETGISCDGMKPDHFDTYDPDEVAQFVNSYASAEVEVVCGWTVLPAAENASKRYLTLEITEFDRFPTVCKKTGPAGSKLQEGHVYVRLGNPARTTVVSKSPDMSAMIELAAEKEARRILRQSARVGLVLPRDDDTLFEQELGRL